MDMEIRDGFHKNMILQSKTKKKPIRVITDRLLTARAAESDATHRDTAPSHILSATV